MLTIFFSEKDEEPMDTTVPKPIATGSIQNQSPDIDKTVLSPNPDGNVHSFPNEYDQSSN
jgi:hypothetical protein